MRTFDYSRLEKQNDIVEDLATLSKATVENALKAMVEAGEIQRHGAVKATFYTRVQS